MVLLKNNKTVALWTGSTNITEKGIFGQCNTGHILRDSTIADKYLSYWECLKNDPDNANTRIGSLGIQSDVDEFADGVIALFSPRSKKKILSIYSNVINKSGQLVCGMFPFSFNKDIKDAIAASTKNLKYVIIDKKTANTVLTSNDFDNVIVYGTVLDTPIYNWLDETNAGSLFKSGTNYIHNKVILIDPLSEAPVVISGSANFSDNSILRNDENTLVIKGDKNVADLYFTEFSRIFNHYSTRSDIKKLTKNNDKAGHNPNHLWTSSDQWINSFYKPSALKAKRKKMFDNMTAVTV
jgi:phosphatidylserine/phosphatidylglycerophosphate/cardiolipin synthase-like enzyme